MKIKCENDTTKDAECTKIRSARGTENEKKEKNNYIIDFILCICYNKNTIDKEELSIIHLACGRI